MVSSRSHARSADALDDRYVQGDDEDDPAPLPSRLPDSARASLPPWNARPLTTRDRVLAWLMLWLGAIGIALGIFFPGTHTEVLLGAILIVFGLRVLFGASVAE